MPNLQKKVKITSACEIFLKTANRIDSFFAHVVFTADSADEMRLHAVKTLATINDMEPDPKDMEKIAMKHLKKYMGLLLEMWLCRFVECYQNYLSSILEEIFMHCPNILNSSEMVKIEDVLKYSTMTDFIKELSEKKVSALSYSSFDDLYNFFSKKLGIDIVNDEDKNLIREAIEIRNISIHNRCIINRRYITKLNLDESLIGKVKEISTDFLSDIIEKLYTNVMDIDKKLIKKFKIKNCKTISSAKDSKK